MPVSAFLPIASCRAKFHRRLSQLAGKVCPVSRADPSEAGQVELDDHHGEGSLNVISSVSVQKVAVFGDCFGVEKRRQKWDHA